jgi:hypothetical protein
MAARPSAMSAAPMSSSKVSLLREARWGLWIVVESGSRMVHRRAGRLNEGGVNGVAGCAATRGWMMRGSRWFRGGVEIYHRAWIARIGCVVGPHNS